MNTARPLPTTSPDTCRAIDCVTSFAVLVPTGEVALSIREAVFGLSLPESYEEWEVHPPFLRMCRDHYRKTRRRDGYTLGYRYRDGKFRAYVKEEHY